MSLAASSGTCPVSVTSPCLLATSTVAAFSAGSENIFALMSVVIASSLGAPIREQDTLIASITANARTPILFLRISSSALAASDRREDWVNPQRHIPGTLVGAGQPHPVTMLYTGKLLPHLEFCWNSLRNAIQNLRHSYLETFSNKSGGA